ncbi:MAG: hypothetical protein WCT16_04510 [Candidatus Buchananbacteria bacterium]
MLTIEENKAELLKQAELGKLLFGKKIRVKNWQGSALLFGVIIALAAMISDIITGIIAACQFQWPTVIGHIAVLFPILIIVYCLMKWFNQTIFELKCYRMFWWEMEDAKRLISQDDEPPKAEA